MRYRALVIYFDAKDGSSSDKTNGLCDALEEIEQIRQQWWLAWQRKPPVRKINYGINLLPASRWGLFGRNQRKTMKRHNPLRDDKLTRAKMEGVVEDVLASKSSSVLVLGHPGTGKGQLALKISESDLSRRSSRYFATFHWTNGIGSVLGGATRFFCPSLLEVEEADPLELFVKAVSESKGMVVLGGVERLLRQPRPEDLRSIGASVEEGRRPFPFGMPASREAERFLKFLAKIGANGAPTSPQVILTSSAIPLVTNEKDGRLVKWSDWRSEKGSVPKVVLIKGHEATEIGMNPRLHREHGRLLHGVLRGHAYALSVVEKCLETKPTFEEQDKWVTNLDANISGADEAKRPELVIYYVLRTLLMGEDDAGLKRDVLQAFALCSVPITITSVAACLGKDDGNEWEEVAKAAEWLEEHRLIIRVTETKQDASFIRYSTHSAVRSLALGGASTGVLPVGSGPEFGPVHSESTNSTRMHGVGRDPSEEYIDKLLAKAESGPKPTTSDGERTKDFRIWRDYIRTAFNLIRTRWSALRVGVYEPSDSDDEFDQPSYAVFQRRLSRLLNLARQSQPLLKNWREEGIGAKERPSRSEIRAQIESDASPFYAEELAWIYNEMGLSAYCRGELPEAHSLFKLGRDMNRVVEHDFKGHRWCHSEINLAAVQIEWANLPRSKEHLSRAIRIAKDLDDLDLLHRAYEYLGLAYHLEGDHEHALEMYNDALKHATKVRDLRATSTILRRRGDLYRFLGKRDKAKRDILDSALAADRGGHLDLLWYTRVADAHFRMTIGESGAADALQPALEYARKTGLPKLEADVIKVQAHIALSCGEAHSAYRLCIQCLGTVSRLGMGLRVTSALVLLGQISVALGHLSAAKGLFNAAIKQGRKQNYQSKVEQAEREKMGIISGGSLLSRKNSLSSRANSATVEIDPVRIKEMTKEE
jgi:tetratricopeptide (TPR) repeat protein